MAAEEQLNDWTMEVVEDDLEPVYDEYDFAGELVPAKPNQVNGLLNKTSAGITVEEAYIAYDMRESYL